MTLLRYKVKHLNKQRYRDYVINEILSPNKEKDTYDAYRYLYVGYPTHPEDGRRLRDDFPTLLRLFRETTRNASDGVGLRKFGHGNMLRVSLRDIRIPLHRYHAWRLWDKYTGKSTWHLGTTKECAPKSHTPTQVVKYFRILRRDTFANKTYYILNGYHNYLKFNVPKFLEFSECTRRSGFMFSTTSYLKRFWHNYENCPENLR